MSEKKTILCFGEVLWDSLPRGIFPGGAPVNVAYHLTQFGHHAVPVTAVGRDFLGDEFLRRFKYWNLNANFVGRVDHPTGAVVVDLDENGVPSYRFLEDVAWDFILLPENLQPVAALADAVVFGTLAQRGEHNRTQLKLLLTQAPHAMKVFDVNLRAPYDSLDLTWELTAGVDLIKLNNEELKRLVGADRSPDELGEGARALSAKSGCPRVCVTAGSDGAGLLWEGRWYWEAGRTVEVRDTVGAGDSFLASLLDGWLERNLAPAENLRRSTRVAEFIATCDGAMPSYQLDASGMPSRHGV